MLEIEISVKGSLLDDLSEDFASFESTERQRRQREQGLILAEWTVARVNGLSIEIRAKEHPPPHFHVTFQGEDASFSIDTCHRLRGVKGLERYESVIHGWWESHKGLLIKKWNEFRPLDCPVGPIQVSGQ
jgi:hypothetical protein